jgi:hypothetical protein
MPGTWTPLVHQPTFSASTMLLLTDGSVMCQESGGVGWHKLAPDAHGSYINGAWTALAPMHQTRLYYASAVLSDGRVIVCGGEYSDAGSETNTGEIYDPIADAWTVVTPPAGWTRIGDAASCLLPDGRLMIGDLDDTRTAIYDPVAGAWSAGPNKGDRSSEETWTLLPDQTVLTVQCSNVPNAEKFVIPANGWVSAGTLPVNLVEGSSIEIGPACLLPDGRVFCVGATNKTALYTMPPVANQPGTWSVGPEFPSINGQTIGAKDAPACLMPNGKVLLVGGPVDGLSGDYLAPTYFFEFDGASLVRISDPPNAGGPPFVGRMLLLPTGQVLFAAGGHALHCYSPHGGPDGTWRPTITAAPAWLHGGMSYTLHGRQLNGLSQAVAYGDDAAAATNYPIVRLRHLATGRITYCRTFDHSTMGVGTGTAVHSTNFDVPPGTPRGASELCVIANGISSPCMSVQVAHHYFIDPHLYEAWNWLIGSLADGPLWVWGPHGPVPVDPWGPLYAKRAAEARKLMLRGMTELAELGREVAAHRRQLAEQVQPAVDPELAAIESRKRGEPANGGGRTSRHARRALETGRPGPAE